MPTTTARTFRCSFAIAALVLLALCPLTTQADQAKQILEATGVKGGLIAHLGCGDPASAGLTCALRANDGYLVHRLDADAANVAKARKHIQSRGLCGTVTAEQWDGKHLPFTDNLVNLVVCEYAGERVSESLMSEITRVLVPNGVAYIKKDGEWNKTVKPRPTNIDEWTHALYDASNNAVANDLVVAPPYHMQWIGGPKWARSHDHLSSMSAVVSSGGRLFSIVDMGPTASVAYPSRWLLVAQDAFNGVVLWQRPIAHWAERLRGFRSGPPNLQRRLVAVGDRVYVTLGYGEPVSALDAATGETVRTYEGTKNALEIACHGGTLFLVIGDSPPASDSAARVPGEAKGKWVYWPIYPTTLPKKRLQAIRADTGDLLWEKHGPDTADLMPTALAIGGERVFLQNPREIVCLEGASGRELWRTARPFAGKRPAWSAPTLVAYKNVVLSADRGMASKPKEVADAGQAIEWVVSSGGGQAPVGELIAFSATDGKKLWSSTCKECYNAPVDVLVADGLVWTGVLVRSSEPGITEGRDPMTGQVKRTRPPDQEFFRLGMGHHRCCRNRATNRYLVLSRDGVEFIDLATGKGIANDWVRGACQYGVIPCNGLLYAPSHSCACHIETKLNGFNALAPKREAEVRGQKSEVRSQESEVRGQNAGERLQRGPAYGKELRTPNSELRTGDWPTYRHDPARSGFTKADVSTDLKPAWSAELGGKLSSPVIADGKVFVADIDAHTVHALDARTGKVAWSYIAGGRVDSPPTIHEGLALFGAADGWVYCLRAADGALVWRFLAAPEDRRVVAYDQLESTWPVHGNILVENGVAYFAAGRSGYLDGGIALYGLDPKTGKVRCETHMDSRNPKVSEQTRQALLAASKQGALTDVFAGDGTSVFMRHTRFDRDLAVQKADVPHLFSPAGFLDGSWWHRTYWTYGTQMRSNWGGWPVVGNKTPSGRLLVTDGESFYGFGRSNQYEKHGSHVGLGKARFRLFACATKPEVTKLPLNQAARDAMKPRDKKQPKPPKKKGGKKRRRQRPQFKFSIGTRWSEPADVTVRAMVLADKTLFIAGPPDMTDAIERAVTQPQGEPMEALAALEGKKGALLRAVSTADGKTVTERKLDSPPVFDGMAAANGRLFLALQNGRVLCLRGGI